MKPSRTKGAQPRNKNALTHGIYSRFITLSDDRFMLDMSDKNTKDELAMARVNFKLAMKKRRKTLDTKEYLACDLACHYWLDTIIEIKLRSAEAGQTAIVVFETFIDAIRAANDRQGVKR